MAITKKPVETITLPRLSLKIMEVVLVGDSPLIMHKWSEKAKKEMLDKQMKKAKPGKEAKDPQKDYEDSIYYHEDGGYGFPSVGIKAAAVSACRNIDGIPMTLARGAFHINGELVKIIGTPNMREDMVKIGMGTADLRYRAEFKKWHSQFEVRFNVNVLSAEQILNLFNTAGFAVGIGEWRPEKDGSFGLFHVATSDEEIGIGN